MATSKIKAESGAWLTTGNFAPSASDTVEVILTRDIVPKVAAYENGVYCLSNNWPNVAGGWGAIVAKCQNNAEAPPSIMGIFGQYQKLYYFRIYIDNSGTITAKYIHQVTMTQIFPT